MSAMVLYLLFLVCAESTIKSLNNWLSMRAIQTHQFLQSHELRLVCNGYYPEIHIIHPRRLEILFSLSAQIQPDWVTALCVLRPVNREGIY